MRSSIWSGIDNTTAQKVLADMDKDTTALLASFPPHELMVIARFMDRVEKTDYCPVEGLEGGGCWIWTGAERNKGGYGAFAVSGKGLVFSHRASYLMFRGPIGSGLVVDHLCRVRLCCNPWHLEAVTGIENVYRGCGVSAENRRKTTCINGHPFDVFYMGRRVCSICRREKLRRWKSNQKEKVNGNA